jgi:hypothetical protein
MRLAFSALVAAAFLLVPSGAALGKGPLETGLWEPEGELALSRVSGAGATLVHMTLHWDKVAPESRPAGFNPEDPQDPAYRWGNFDARVISALKRGLRPSIDLHGAPPWAKALTDGDAFTARPDPTEFGHFAKAAALRYSGRFANLPHVRHWQVWAEQNLYYRLNRLFTPSWYRRMLNSVAAAIKSIRRDNIVITGGLAPFTPKGAHRRIAPLNFMREMLCLSRQLKRTCADRSHFDVWAHHPYTSGGPTHQAYRRDDVSLGDLPEMRRILIAAYRNGSIVSRGEPQFWITEFGWDTKPPDPGGVPLALHARWVAEALYRMWQSDVRVVIWLQLRDLPLVAHIQGGLYFRGATIEQDRPKPALQAFRFPLVAFPRAGGVYVWGRTPAGVAGRVIVQQSFRGGWRRLGTLRANRYGIFEHRFSSKPAGWIRARNVRTGELSRAFSLKHHPDRFFNPFGGTGSLERGRK